MQKQLQLFLLVLFTIVGGLQAKAQKFDYLVFEQNGLYWYINEEGNAYLLEGALGAYYIAHDGDLTNWDYNAQHEVLPGYRGSVTIPAEVTYQGKTYPVTNISGFKNNPYLTSLTVNAAITSISIYNAAALQSLTLNNTSMLSSMYITETGLSTLYIPETVTYVSLSDNQNMKSVSVAPGNPTYQSVNGLLTRKPSNNYWKVEYVPEGIEGRLVLPEGITECVSLQHCKKITEVVLPSTFNIYRISELLNNTNGIKVSLGSDKANLTVLDGMITNKAKDTVIYILPSQAETLTIPAGVRIIYDTELTNRWGYSSERMPNLKTMNLPASFDFANNSFFLENLHYAKKLEAVNVNAASPTAESINGVIRSKTDKKLLFAPPMHAEQGLIPDGTLQIGSYALANCQNLKQFSIPASISSIDYNAFLDCPNLESAVIPATVKSMGAGLFYNCGVLKKATIESSCDFLPNNMFYGCSSLQEVSLPQNLLQIQGFAFNGCTSLTAITIPSTVQTIYEWAFANCTKLKEATLPASLLTLGNEVFINDSCLTSLTIPASVTQMGYGLTRSCPQLRDIRVASGSQTFSDIDGVVFSADKRTLVQFPSGRKEAYAVPEGTHNISNYAFYYCDSLKAITFPNTLDSIRSGAFQSINSVSVLDFPASAQHFDYNWLSYAESLKKIVLRTSEKMIVYNMVSAFRNKSVYIYVHEKNFADFQSYDSDQAAYTVFSLGSPFGVTNVRRYLRGLRFNVIENDMVDMEKTMDVVTVNNQNAKWLADGSYYMAGLKPYTTYPISVSYLVKGEKQAVEYTGIRTNQFSTSCKATTTQSTATITRARLRNYADTTAVPQKLVVEINGTEYPLTEAANQYEANISENIFIDGLTPGTSVPVKFTVVYQDGEEYTANNSVSTRGFDPRGVDYKLTPTTLRLNITYTEIDAVPDSVAFIFNTGNNYSRIDTLYAPITNPVFTGLTPGTKLNSRGVYLISKGKIAGYSISFNNFYNLETPQLELATGQPQIPAQGRAIVAATTNTGDDEGRIGFEWRKYDAPSELKSMEGYGIVYNGTAQGQIKNLSTSNYYKVRAFYDDLRGTRYYAKNGPSSDGWVTFDPSEISEMEPVVHTSAETTATNTTVLLVGTMIQGSEDIIEQGFEYWEVVTDSEGNTARRLVRKAQADVEHHTIAVTGQRMTAEITGLTPGTDYAFRAYAKTAKGTVYGEERSFRTNGEKPVSGIEDMTIAQELTVKATTRTGTLQLVVTAQHGQALVTVVSLHGKLLLRQTVPADGSTVELTGMPHGMVIVNVKAGHEEQTLKTLVR